MRNLNIFQSAADKKAEDNVGDKWQYGGMLDLYALNWWVAMVHGAQFAIMFVLVLFFFPNRMQGIPYVSSIQNLTVTSHAMTHVSTNTTTCIDVRNSPQYNQAKKVPYRVELMPTFLYDFTDTFPVQFNSPGYSINTAAIICVFFLLSFIFQMTNGGLINENPKYPRVMTYLEYSISSSLMIMVLGVNIGVLELFQLIWLFGLFFGMNIFGMLAELMCHMAERNPALDVKLFGYDAFSMWKIPHYVAWILFFLAYVPLLIKYATTCKCSTPSPPWFMTVAVCVETVFFLLFGVVQWVGLSSRMEKRREPVALRDAIIWMDLCHIVLSFFAKTSLAWLLVGPALSLQENTAVY
jgi:hypothetical protein